MSFTDIYQSGTQKKTYYETKLDKSTESYERNNVFTVSLFFKYYSK